MWMEALMSESFKEGEDNSINKGHTMWKSTII